MKQARGPSSPTTPPVEHAVDADLIELARQDPDAFNRLVDGPMRETPLTPPPGYRYETPTEPWPGTAGRLDRAGMKIREQRNVGMVMIDRNGADVFSRQECDLAEREQRPARPTEHHGATRVRWTAAVARPRLAVGRPIGRSRERRAGAVRTRGSRRRSGSSPPSSDDGPGEPPPPGDVVGWRHEIGATR